MLTVTDSNNAMKWLARGFFMVLVFILYIPSVGTADLPADIPGCAVTAEKPYNGVFNTDDFQWTSSGIDSTTGRIKLLTGDTALDPTNIEIRIPIEQSVGVTFLYEDAGFSKTIIGWMLKSEVVVNDVFIGWSSVVSSGKNHPIYTNIQDSVYPGGSRAGGDGILDDGATPRVQIGGGTLGVGANKTFIPGLINWVIKDWNLDTVTDMRDSRVVLGTTIDYKFPAGSEIVFYLDSSPNTDLNRYTNNQGTFFTTLTACNNSNKPPCRLRAWYGGTFFSKADWNTDQFGLTPSVNQDGTKNYCSTTDPVIQDFNKTFYLGVYAGYSACGPSQWLDAGAVTRLKNPPLYLDFGSTQKQIHIQQLQTHFPYAMVGAPSSKPNEWVLGWEDWATGGDYDMNDVVIRVDRQTVGMTQLLSDKAIPASSTPGSAYFSSVTIEVTDSLPCPTTLPALPKTTIDYSVSIDNGVSWLKVTTWDVVKTPDKNGTAVSNWSPGHPVPTYRSCRLDFAANAMIGEKLIWKAEMNSTDVTCVPEIIDVKLTYVTATNGLVSRASPSVQTNMLYSGSYETPPYPVPWTDKSLRGHLFGRRLYDPADPSKQKIDSDPRWNWDAGAVLTAMEPSARTIYVSNVTSALLASEEIAKGTGTTSNFKGTLAHYPVSANTITITGDIETFTDEGPILLVGDKGGAGTINRSTGVYDITFSDSIDADGATIYSPPINSPIIATYSYYTTAPTMKLFTSTNVTNAMLGLGNDLRFDKAAPFGGSLTEADGAWLVNWVRGYKDGVSTKKDWLLGAIDHSVPAVQTPPPRPSWYLGTKSLVATAKAKGQVTAAIKEEAERLDSYDKFFFERYERPTVIYVGARDGMLHAFDGGAFRWGFYVDKYGAKTLIPKYTDEFIWGDNPDTTSTEYRGYFKLADYGTGKELWAYIPGNLISRLKNNYLSGDDQAFVDASPTLSDVEIKVSGEWIWKTILLSAQGNGGDTVFCLDVTNTEQPPTFLWEFADPDLFRSRSSPSVSVIGQINHNGERKWVAFFVSGKANSNEFPSIYMIDVTGGTLLEHIFLTSDPDSIGRGGIPSGQPALVDSDGNGYIDRIYIGTDKGYLYKVTIPDDPSKTSAYGITNCVINTDIGSATLRNPIYASPAVVVQNTYNDLGKIKDLKIKIFFGTSDSPYTDDSLITPPGTLYHFFAYEDTAKKTDTCGAANLDWQYQLPAGERVFASAFAAAGTVYFGTATSELEDPCEGSGAANVAKNAGKLYAMNINKPEDSSTPITPKFSMKTGNILSAPVVDDQHLYVKTPYGLLNTPKPPYNNPGVGPVEAAAATWREVFSKDEIVPLPTPTS